MKRAILSALVIGLTAVTAQAQVEDAPAAVKQAAAAAVNEMGKEVVLGHHQVAIDRMYPPYKESLAKSVGSMEKLQAQLAEVPKKMAQQGISLRSFRTEGEPVVYEVDSGKQALLDDKGKPVLDAKGKALETMIYKKWLVVIPTVTEIMVTGKPVPNENPKLQVVLSHSFQVAISDKDKSAWSFIDGSGLRVSDLRRLFFSLPETMVLPEIRGEEKKDK
ncbi:hypothetical protein [Haloferula sp. BvORR071]|uniref:hypothetical protein n=1 Tax=Haloferula sp. BvORR071 TaxID=1396141 RepID=UPI000553F4CE|nr:hypothetical protein [Haloferula sp. BvORR071]